MKTSPSPVYEFGEFQLDVGRRLISRRDGSLVPLTPRVFETLLYMVEHSGAVLDKDQLMAAIWPDTVVEENNLTQNISTLRRVLGEERGSHRFIVTVPGRGYRFVADVRTREENEEVAKQAANGNASRSARAALADMPTGTAETNTDRTRRFVFGAIIAAAVIAIVLLLLSRSRTDDSRRSLVSDKSIAVLPFENLSADPESAYFVDGVKDEILSRLWKIGALKVVSRTSTLRIETARGNVRAIAQQLGVANVLEGSVQRSGDSVRVAVQLINAQSDTHIWAETYDRKLADMFQVESEIAERIAAALEATLSGAETRAVKATPTVSVAAHQAYLKGRYFWNKRSLEGYQEAIGYFNSAVELDPDYAQAYVGLSDALLYFAERDAVRHPEAEAQGRAALQKALELDDGLPDAHASRGLMAMNLEWNWAKAERELKRAMELDPNYATAHHWYGEVLLALGRFDEALSEINKARELDPLSLAINTDIGKVLFYSRRYDEAIAELRETLKMDPQFEQARFWLASAYTMAGRYEEAIAQFEAIRHESRIFGWLIYPYLMTGRRAEAEQITDAVRKLDTEMRQRDPEQPLDRLLTRCVALAYGDKDEAFALLEQDYRTKPAALTSLKVDPRYDSLRSDPRFADLLRRVHLAQ